MALVKCIDPRDEETLRQYAMPAEFLPRRAVPNGGYRYFRAPNIIPIEHYRLSEPRHGATYFKCGVIPFRRRSALDRKN